MNKSVQEVCVEKQISVDQLAELSGLDSQRVLAIFLGRWTPSPEERDKISEALGTTKDQLAWGHKTPIQHIYGIGSN